VAPVDRLDPALVLDAIVERQPPGDGWRGLIRVDGDAAGVTARGQQQDERRGAQDGEPARQTQDGIEKAQAGAEEQHGHQRRDSVEASDHGLHFVRRQLDRQSAGALGANHTVDPADLSAKHVPVEEQQRAQRLVLCRCTDAPPDRKARQEGARPGASCHGTV
jgi:hypothetical protein